MSDSLRWLHVRAEGGQIRRQIGKAATRGEKVLKGVERVEREENAGETVCRRESRAFQAGERRNRDA